MLIFAYNRRAFLPDAINSVLSQLDCKMNVEVIVSTCFPVMGIKDKFQRGGIRFIEFPNDTKYGEQFVKTFDFSEGNIIFILEDDDVFIPGKIKNVLQLFESSDKLICVKDSMTVFHNLQEITKVLEYSKSVPIKFKEIWLESSYRTYRYLAKIRLWASPSSLAVKRDLIESNRDFLNCSDPIDLILGMAILNNGGLCVSIETPLTAIRVHSSNDSMSFLSVCDRSQYNRYLRTLERYTSGMICAISKSTNMSFLAWILIREYFAVQSLQNEAISGRSLKDFFRNGFAIPIKFMSEFEAEANKSEINLREKFKWYLYFTRKMSWPFILSLLYFIRNKRLEKIFANKL